MTTSQAVDYFNLLKFPKFQILKTKQSVQAMPYCMYFRKHSCLEDPFNQQMNLYSSSGLIVQWAKNFKKPPFKRDRTDPKALSLNQIGGVLVICIFMAAASVIVFSFELMSNCHGTIKTIMDFFTFKANAISRCKFTFFQRNHH